jgi:hypothetical protein
MDHLPRLVPRRPDTQIASFGRSEDDFPPRVFGENMSPRLFNSDSG